jgi:hypothetical protein
MSRTLTFICGSFAVMSMFFEYAGTGKFTGAPHVSVDPHAVRGLGLHCVLPELPFVLLQFPALEIFVVLFDYFW